MVRKCLNELIMLVLNPELESQYGGIMSKILICEVSFCNVGMNIVRKCSKDLNVIRFYVGMKVVG